MSNDLTNLVNLRRNPTDRALLGLTVLLVEDSRFASEAMRLICQRTGARLRRADCLRSARRHLQSYRPAVVIVDMGLPDGRGEELIVELAAATPRLPVILGLSGDPATEAAARAAGANGFLAKPLGSVATFQDTVLAHLGSFAGRVMPPAEDRVTPDRLALRDDLAVAVDGLRGDGDIVYLASFLTGVARSAGDMDLETAAGHLARSHDRLPMAEMIEARLSSNRPF